MNYRKEMIEAKLWLSAFLTLTIVVEVHFIIQDQGLSWSWLMLLIALWWLSEELHDAWRAHKAGKTGLAL